MKTKTTTTFLTALLIGGTILAQSNSDIPSNPKIDAVDTEIGTIQTTMDLTKVIEDKVPITINPERFKQDTVIYRLPKVIPGDKIGFGFNFL